MQEISGNASTTSLIDLKNSFYLRLLDELDYSPLATGKLYLKLDNIYLILDWTFISCDEGDLLLFEVTN